MVVVKVRQEYLLTPVGGAHYTVAHRTHNRRVAELESQSAV